MNYRLPNDERSTQYVVTAPLIVAYYRTRTGMAFGNFNQGQYVPAAILPRQLEQLLQSGMIARVTTNQ